MLSVGNFLKIEDCWWGRLFYSRVDTAFPAHSLFMGPTVLLLSSFSFHPHYYHILP